MPDNSSDLIANLSYGALFVVLFLWTLRESVRREERLLAIIECYNKQLESIAMTLDKILEKIELLGKSDGR